MTLRQAYLAGIVTALPFLIVLVPFALVFGVVSTNAGLSLAQVMGFSTLVLAGASQITAVQLIADGAPMAIVLISAFAVNLRMAMYSAAITPWIGAAPRGLRALAAFVLIDQTFALAMAKYEAEPHLTVPQRLAYFFGTATILGLPWPFATLAGATLGRAIPASFALDFAVPITFLAMVAPMLKTRAQAACAATGFLAALAFSGLPNGLGLMIAAPLAMAVGAVMERRA